MVKGHQGHICHIVSDIFFPLQLCTGICHLLTTLPTCNPMELPTCELKESSCRHFSRFLTQASVEEGEVDNPERSEVRALVERARSSLEQVVNEREGSTGVDILGTLLEIFRKDFVGHIES